MLPGFVSYGRRRPEFECSSPILDAISKNYTELIEEMDWLDDSVVEKLQAAQVLTADEVNSFRQQESIQDIKKDIIEIVKTRTDRSFYIFCNILKNHPNPALQTLGNKLRKDMEAPENLDILHDVPELPSHHLIVRDSFVNTTATALMKMNFSQGRLLVHGIPGSGKTMAVANSIRHMVKANDLFTPNGIFWTKIGDINKDDLAMKLRKLCRTVSNDDQQAYGDLDCISLTLKQYFSADHMERKFILFVFEDVRNESYLDYLQFAKNVVITSPLTLSERLHQFDYVTEAPGQFELQQSWQLLASFQPNIGLSTITANQVIASVIEYCRCYPLAITLLGGARLQSEEEWKEALVFIQQNKEDSHGPSENYPASLCRVFQFVINRLPSPVGAYYRLLGAFKKSVKIPVAAIATLWDQSQQLESILKDLHSRSLIVYHRDEDNAKSYCQIHGTLSDLLLQNPDKGQQSVGASKQYRQSLHNTLLNLYRIRWGNCWWRIHDQYIQEHLIYHLVEASEGELISKLTMDILWAEVNLKIRQSLTDLLQDLQRCQEYLHSKGIFPKMELYETIRKNEVFLSKKPDQLLQSLLICTHPNNQLYKLVTDIAQKQVEYEGKAYVNLSFTENMGKWQNTLQLGDEKESCNLALSNPIYGPIRVAFMKSYGSPTVCDYATTKVLFSTVACGECVVTSADGKYMGFGNNPRRDSEYLSRIFHVWNIEMKFQMRFRDQNNKISSSFDGIRLEFSNFNLKLCAGISSNFEVLYLWEIQGDIFQCLKTATFKEDHLHYCNFIPMTSSMIVGINTYYKPKCFGGDENYNVCQLQIWNVPDLSCQSSIKVPGRLASGTYLPIQDSSGSNDCVITAIRYVNDDYFAVSYESTCVKCIFGVLKTKFCTGKTSKEFYEQWSEMFIQLSDDSVQSFDVSEDGQLLVSLTKSCNVLLHQRNFNGFELISKVAGVQTTKEIKFCDQGHGLLSYDGNNIYHMVLPAPCTDHLSPSSEVISCEFGIVNGIPVVVRHITAEGTAYLKISYGRQLDQTSFINLGKYTKNHLSGVCNRQKIYVYEHLGAVVYIDNYTCINGSCVPSRIRTHYHVVTQFKYDLVTGFKLIGLGSPCKVLWTTEEIVDNDDFRYLNLQSFYRKSGNRLIFIQYGKIYQLEGDEIKEINDALQYENTVSIGESTIRQERVVACRDEFVLERYYIDEYDISRSLEALRKAFKENYEVKSKYHYFVLLRERDHYLLTGYDHSQGKLIEGSDDSILEKDLFWPKKYFPYVNDEHKSQIDLYKFNTLIPHLQLRSPKLLKKIIAVKMNQLETMLMCQEEDGNCSVIQII
ncbi:Apoptotic protease-activating factor 1 [Trichoplax sp. H2]|nr:Apoptotic protease-activating factor 1 [Trichoplax sp. H2]|eukprot:RDD37847.1 Apoptotic protease-activating factor 1 [Trichoplax sp. H2]